MKIHRIAKWCYGYDRHLGLWWAFDGNTVVNAFHKEEMLFKLARLDYPEITPRVDSLSKVPEELLCSKLTTN